MIGGFVGFQGNQSNDWGENLLSSAATNTIRQMFTSSDSVEVEIRCNPSSKLLQGSIDSFKMSGKGLVIRKVFRAEEMSFETDAVSIDFGSALKGAIHLKQATQAIADVKLTEEDINQAFKAELVRKRLENLTYQKLTELSGGNPVSFTDLHVDLLSNNRLKLFAKADLSGGKIVPVSLSCTLAVERRRRIVYKDAQFEPDAVPEELHETSKQLMDVLVEIFNNMVDLDRFNLDGITMRINRLETEGKILDFSGYAQIERIPRV